MKLNRADRIKAIELAEKHGISLDEMKKIISSPYELIQIKTRELVFKDDLSKEEFNRLKTNFNIPSLGKLFASNYLYNEIQKKKKKK
jgi:hypothetical protein